MVKLPHNNLRAEPANGGMVFVPMGHTILSRSFREEPRATISMLVYCSEQRTGERPVNDRFLVKRSRKRSSMGKESLHVCRRCNPEPGGTNSKDCCTMADE